MVNVNNIDKTTKEILDSYLAANNIEFPDMPIIETTDDIGESEVYTDLISSVVGDNVDGMTVTLPFARYSEFNPMDRDHEFKMMARYPTSKFGHFYIGGKEELLRTLAALESDEAFINFIYDFDKDTDIPEYVIAILEMDKSNIVEINSIDLVKLKQLLTKYIDIVNININSIPDVPTLHADKIEVTGSKSDWHEPLNKFNEWRLTSKLDPSRILTINNKTTTPRPHYGEDYGTPQGTPIFAVHAGTLTYRDRRDDRTPGQSDRTSGNMIAILHPSSKLLTQYMHLDDTTRILYRKNKTRQVLPGQLIGWTGNTGSGTGFHLHLDMSYPHASVPPAASRLPKLVRDNGRTYVSPRKLLTVLGATKGDINNVDILSLALQKDIDVLSDIRRQITSMTRVVSTSIYQKEFGNITRSVLLDLKGKVESLSINAAPGTSIPIPMEGEEDPVIQSTGGRLVNVTIQYKETDPINLSKLGLLFNTQNSISRTYGMLALSMNIMKGRSDSINRFQTLHRVLQHKFVDKLIKGLSGSTYINITEPMIVSNPILNGLGLYTFVAKELEVNNTPGHPGTFDVKLTMMYNNVSARSLESLRKERNTSLDPIMPAAVRLPEPGPEDTNDPTSRTLHMLKNWSSATMQYGMSDLASIYALYRLNLYVNNLENIPEGDELDVTNNGISTMVTSLTPDEIDNIISAIGDINSDNVSSIPRPPSVVTGGLMNISSIFITSSIVSKLKRIPSMVDMSTVFTSKIPSIKPLSRLNRFGAIIGPVLGTVSTVSSAWGGYVSRSSVIPTTISESDRNTSRGVALGVHIPSNAINENKWNTPTECKLVYYIPQLAVSGTHDFVRDYINSIIDNNTEDFFSKISKGAADIIQKLTRDDQFTRGEYRFKSPVKLKTANGPSIVTHIIISMVSGGIHVNEKIISDAIGQFKTGLPKLKDKLKDNLESYGRVNNNEHINLIMPYIINQIMLTNSATSAGLGSSISNSNMTIPKLESLLDTCNLIIGSDSAKEHAKSILCTYITSSMLDIYASILFDTIDMKAITKTDPQMVEEYQALSTTIVNVKRAREIAKEKRINHSTIIRILYGIRGKSKDVDDAFLACCLLALTAVKDADIYSVNQSIPTNVQNELRRYNIKNNINNKEIVDILYPSISKLVTDSILVLSTMVANMAPGFIIYELLSYAAAAIVATILGIALSKVIVALAIISLIVFIGFTIVTFLIGEGIKTFIHIKNLYQFSMFMARKIGDITDARIYIMLCIKSELWFRDIESLNQDIISDKSTSYVDYPVVDINGLPAMPDLFIHKVDHIDGQIQALHETVNMIVESANEKIESEDGLDFKELMQKYREYMTEFEHTKGELLPKLEFILTGIHQRRYSETLEPKHITDAFDALNTIYGSKIIWCKIGNIETKSNRDNAFIRIEFGLGKGKDFRNDMEVFHLDSITFGDDTSISRDNDLVETINDPGLIGSRYITSTRTYPNQNTIDIIRSMYITIGNALSNHINTIRVSSHMLKSYAPNTLGNLMALKGMIGNSMPAVGKPGIAMLTNSLNTMSKESMRKIATFRSSYMYPTIKLYFIEEDDEAYYLFDDLYSYASILSVSVHKDKHSPADVCTLKISNLMGHLTNIMSNEFSRDDNYFTTPADGNLPLNSIMLKPGAKVKIQAGHSPILYEDNTIFIGEITSITPGPITSIEAMSYGKIFLEDFSMNKVKTWPEEIGEGVLSRTSRKLQSALLSWGSYFRPITSIMDVVKYLLTHLTGNTPSISSFRANKAAEVSINLEDARASASITEALYTNLYPKFMSWAIEQTGYETDIMPNDQLFENVNISGEKNSNRFSVVFAKSQGSWTSYQETAWDVIQSLNLLLPNNIATVRPYDTRNTFVWGHPDDYYRYKQSTDMNSIISTMLAEKMRGMAYNNNSKTEGLLLHINDALRSKNEQTIGAALALIVLIATNSQRVSRAALNTEYSKFEFLTISDLDNYSTTIKKCILWIGLGASISQSHLNYAKSILDDNVSDWDILKFLDKRRIDKIISNLDSAQKDIHNAVSSSNVELDDELSQVKLGGSGIFSQGPHHSTILLSLEFACNDIAYQVYAMSCEHSGSHKRITNTHIKSSGIDIVKNSMSIQYPYNTVTLGIPAKDVTGADVFTEIGTLREEMNPVSVHYKIKPWSRKTYSAYFPNMGIFREARTATRSMVTSSILTNLMKDTYDGYITVLDDESINPGDRVLINDEVNDIIGFVEAESVTYTISVEEGALTTIKPKMITSNNHIIVDNIAAVTSGFLRSLGITLGVGILMAGAYFLTRKGGQMFQMKQLAKGKATSSRIIQALDHIAKGKTTGVGSWVASKQVAQKIGETLGIGTLNSLSTKAPTQVKNIFKYGAELSEKTVGPLRNNELYSKSINGILKKDKINLIIPDEEITAIITRASVRTKTITPDSTQLIKYMDDVAESYNVSISKDIQDFIAKSGISVPAPTLDKIIKGVNGLNKFHVIGTKKHTYGPAKEIANIIDSLKSNPNLTKLEQAAVDNIVNYVTTNSHGLVKLLSTISTLATASFVGEFIFSKLEDIVDFMLNTGMTSDNVTISPVFCKGEPYVVGIEGMVKQDGVEAAGTMDYLKSRLGQIGEVMGYAFTDSMKEAYYEFQKENKMLKDKPE